jgi:hypothetical protein
MVSWILKDGDRRDACPTASFRLKTPQRLKEISAFSNCRAQAASIIADTIKRRNDMSEL